MNKSEDIINLAESNGFIRDIEDNVWYTKDYKQRIVPQYYCYHPYSVYYGNGGFDNPVRFRNVEELVIILNNSREKE